MIIGFIITDLIDYLTFCFIGFIDDRNDIFIIASDRVRTCMKELNIADYRVTDYCVKGKDLEGTIAEHPFINRESIVITGNHVNLESGTGCVHTAPGHGVEDFECCTKYNFEILVPVDEHGKMTSQAGEFCGLTLDDIAHEFECSRRSAERMKAVLVEKFGNKIEEVYNNKDAYIEKMKTAKQADATETIFKIIDGMCNVWNPWL